MPALVKETGTGSATSNSYANAADGDLYHDKHSWSAAWAGATAVKEEALMMATRLIDNFYQFKGWKVNNVQALQWPREGALDPDREGVRLSILDNNLGPYFPSDAIPPVLVDATCELARELLAADRTAAPDGEGVKQLALVGSLQITFDKSDTRPVIPQVVQIMLSKLGTLLNTHTGIVRLVRT